MTPTRIARSRTRTALRALATLVVAAIAATSGLQAQYRIDSVATIESRISPILFTIAENGVFGYDGRTGESGFIFPRGARSSYLYGAGLWFGARKGSTTALPLVFSTFNPNTNRSSATPGEYEQSDAYRPPYMHHSVDYDRTYGHYVGPDSAVRPAWPLWRRGAQRDPTVFSPGHYESLVTERIAGGVRSGPAFAQNADEQFVLRYHDRDLARYELDSAAAVAIGYPIGLQIEQQAFAWQIERGNERSVVLRYAIINRSGETLYDCVAALAADPDIGSAGNDHLSFHIPNPELRTGYAWSDAEEGLDAGTLAMTLVEAPTVGNDGMVDNTRRPEYRQQGRVGAFPYWTSDYSNDPVTYSERYRKMTERAFTVDSIAGDFRALLASTPFALRAGDTAYFSVALTVVRGTPPPTIRGPQQEGLVAGFYDELERDARLLIDLYYTESGMSGAARSDGADGGLRVDVLPNPVSDRALVRATMPGSGEGTLRLVDLLGRTLATRTIRAAGGDVELDLSTLPSGTYTLQLDHARRSVRTRVVVRH